jgi:hypothetical protein
VTSSKNCATWTSIMVLCFRVPALRLTYKQSWNLESRRTEGGGSNQFPRC